jgi:hypothetical protein
MLSLNRRVALAALSANLLAGPVLAQGRADALVGVTGRVFLHEKGGVPALTNRADAKGAMVTSHIGEGASRLAVVDGQFQPHAAIELQTGEGLRKPVQRLTVSDIHPDHWSSGYHFCSAVRAGPVTGKFLIDNAARVVAERKADICAPEVAGIVAGGTQTIGDIELRIRHVLNAGAPEIPVVEIPVVEIPVVGAASLQDIVHNKVHVVVLLIDNWIGVLQDVAKRAAAAPLILAGHGAPASPTDLRGLVDLEAVKPLLAANIGKPDQTKAITDDIAKAFPAYQLPPLLTLASSRALLS